ncbi:MAG: ECF transporter S component [Tissierellia bacterium]|nr:ECF transporter S component [Tissierellia bacterium]
MKKYEWKLQDVIMVSLLCVVFGVVYLAAVYLATFLSTVFTPFGLAPLANELVFGIWLMAATIAAYIIQKPTVAIIAEILAAVIEVMLGNWFGPMVIVAGFIQGLGAELVFAMYKYERFDMTTMLLAATGSCITSFAWSFVRSGYGNYSLGLLILFFIVRIISTLIFAGVLSKAMGDGLAKTKLLKGYAIGRE